MNYCLHYDDEALLGLDLDSVLEGNDVLPAPVFAMPDQIVLPPLSDEERLAIVRRWRFEESAIARLEAELELASRRALSGERNERNALLENDGFKFEKRVWREYVNMNGGEFIHWVCSCGAQGWVSHDRAAKSFVAHTHKAPKGWTPGTPLSAWQEQREQRRRALVAERTERAVARERAVYERFRLKFEGPT